MRQRLLARAFLVGSWKKLSLPEILICVGLTIGFSTVASSQTMIDALSGKTRPEASGPKDIADSVSPATNPFVSHDLSTSSISPRSDEKASQGGGVLPDATSDEDRVIRGDKKDRVLKIVPMGPPKSFSAGSVLQRQSSLLEPGPDDSLKMAFAIPEINGREIKIATAFHLKRKTPRNSGMAPAVVKLINNDKPDILATAYAPVAPDYANNSPFETLLRNDPNNGRFIPPVGKGDHGWMATPLPASVFSKEEQKCLATAVYFEARGEDAKGQAAVAQVVLNRVRNPAYPDTVCGVVYQNDHWRNGCQFSFACDGIKDRITSPRHYKLASEIAMAVTAGKVFIPEVGSATHYHATYVRPRWSKTMEKMRKIGLHVFYRTYGGGWS